MADSKLAKQVDDVMRALSSLSGDAKASGDTSLMYATNRAWVELFEHQKATEGRNEPVRDAYKLPRHDPGASG